MSRDSFSAYYYELQATGNKGVDGILEAVADAGKAYHHTGDWNEEDRSGHSQVELIQKAANEAAEQTQMLALALSETADVLEMTKLQSLSPLVINACLENAHAALAAYREESQTGNTTE